MFRVPCRSVCVGAHATYGANEIHFHFKATSQQQQKLLSSINVILGTERDRDSHILPGTVHGAAVSITFRLAKALYCFFFFRSL